MPDGACGSLPGISVRGDRFRRRKGRRSMKKIIGGLLTAAAAVFLLTGQVSAEEPGSMRWGYTPDGCYYQESSYNDECSFRFEKGENCTFSCEWEESDRCFAEMGLKMPGMYCAENISAFFVKYQAELFLAGNSYFGLHCKMHDLPGAAAAKEIYTVEAWGEWRPPGGFSPLAVESVGYNMYEYFSVHRYNEPTVEGARNLDQYWCVRTQNAARLNAPVTLSREQISLDRHLEVLLQRGMLSPGEMPEYAALYLDSYRSAYAGYCRVTSADYYLSGVKYETTAPVTTAVTSAVTTTTAVTTTAAPKIEADADGCYFRSDFENGSCRWQSCERSRLRHDENNYVDGHSSLLVTNRFSASSGVTVSLKPYALKPETMYDVGVCVMQKAEETASFILYFEDPEGTMIFLDEVYTECGQWALLKCSFTVPHFIPDGSENMRLYISSDSPDADFYIDAAGLWDEDCMPEMDLSAAVSDFTAETIRHTNADDGLPLRAHQNDEYTYVHGGGGAKDQFGRFFRMGFCASAEDLEDPVMQAFYRKQFNSVSCKNELLPENTVKEIGDGIAAVSLDAADPVLKFAEQNALGFRGSALVNGSSMPAEMLSGTAEEREARLESMIRGIFAGLKQNYPSLDLYAYDVCRDVLLQESRLPAWRALSEDDRTAYIIAAFRYARMYAPENCKLFLSANALSQQHADAAAVLAEKIMEAGDYIDGIALQGKLTNRNDSVRYEAIFWRFASLGLDIQISELQNGCAGDEWLSSALPENLMSQAFCFSEAVTGVTFYAPVCHSESYHEQECSLFDAELVQTYLYYNLVIQSREAIVHGAEMFDGSTERNPDSWEPPVLGDVDGNGMCDMYDVLQIIQYLSEGDNVCLSDRAIENADYDLDGLVTMSDVMGILQWLKANPDLW